MKTILTDDVFRSLLDRHPDPVTVHTPVFSEGGVVVDFILAYCNECQRVQANLPVDQMIGQKVTKLYGYSDQGRQQLFDQLLQVYNRGEDLESTYYNEVLDTFFRVHRRKVNNSVLTLARNVSAEIKERLEKERQTDLTNRILNTSLSAWFTCEAVFDEWGAISDFTITSANHGFTKITGLKEPDVVGKSYLSLFPSAIEQGTFELDTRVFLTGKTERVQMPYKGDGFDGWFDIAVAKLDDRTILINFSDTTEHINALKEVEQKSILLDSILFHSAAGIAVGKMIRDETGQIIDARNLLANEAVFTISGIPREHYFSKTAREIEPNIAQSPYFQKVVHTMQTREPAIAQYKVETSGRWVEITLSCMNDDQLLIIYNDITEAKEAQIQQERLIADLKRSNEALEEFTRSASHDLKEPIRKVQFFADRLRNTLGVASPESMNMLERLDKAATRMRLLIDDLLSYAQVNQRQDAIEQVSLNEVLNLIQVDLELIIEEKKAVIHVGNLPTLSGYSRQLQQVFHNLLVNAINYSKPGVPPVINISASLVMGRDSGTALSANNQERWFHLIEIADNGIGFEQEYAEKIFQVFARLHGNYDHSGSGVGLAIVRKAVENHNGFVWAISQPQEGATFKILLPLEPTL